MAECSLISYPNHKIMAAYKSYEQQLLKQDVGREVGIEEQLPEIQILKYNTHELSEADCIDAITMIQTIRESDERIEMAIDEMMGDYEWYTG